MTPTPPLVNKSGQRVDELVAVIQVIAVVMSLPTGSHSMRPGPVGRSLGY